MAGSPWPDWQIDLVRAAYPRRGIMPPCSIGHICRTTGRTYRSVVLMAYRLGVATRYKKPGRVSPDEYIQLLVAKAAVTGTCHLKILKSCHQSHLLVRLKHEVWADMRDAGASWGAIEEATGHDHSTVLKAVRKVRESRNPSVPTGNSSAQTLATRLGKEVPSLNIAFPNAEPSNSRHTFERLAVSDPCSQPELEAAE